MRRALINSLAQALVRRGRIETTVAKAKEIKPIVEKMVSRAKKGDRAFKFFSELAKKYQDRKGGYLRIIRTKNRGHDRAEMAILEFVE